MGTTLGMRILLQYNYTTCISCSISNNTIICKNLFTLTLYSLLHASETKVIGMKHTILPACAHYVHHKPYGPPWNGTWASMVRGWYVTSQQIAVNSTILLLDIFKLIQE